MRIPSLLGPTTADRSSLSRICLSLLPFIHSTFAITSTPVPSSNLDLSQLGQVALAGNFDAISLYTYAEQSETGFSANGSQALLGRLPNGAFATLLKSDARITAMCPFVMREGKLAGVVVGGNFTSLGGVEAQAIALYDPVGNKVTPLTGLSGKVSTLLCDQEQNTVFVGGEFKGANSTNAIAWVGMDGWTNLPFEGFNGPVRSITKTSNGTVVFGGSFTGLGNSTGTGPTKKDQQVINLSAATVTATLSSFTNGFNQPKNIVCKNGQGGAGNSWLLQDGVPGAWKASFKFGFRPTKLRLWNANQDGRGTKTFRFTALPINGIMNLTYVGDQGQNVSCDARCPLPQSNGNYTDFHFINIIGMSEFQIDISEWYGAGGGLNGIELFQDDIYAFAINDFNEPSCANLDFPSAGTATGPWSTSVSGVSNSDYLTADLSGASIDSKSASVVFRPDIRQSGNYSVTVFTPGCIGDGSCASRGVVKITGEMATGTRTTPPIDTEFFQTNNYDKYDEVYRGYVDAASGAFRPTVTLTPGDKQSGALKFVAQRVRFELMSTTGGLNGLFEFNPNAATVDTDFSASAYNKAGMGFDSGALIKALSTSGQTTFAAGNFSTSDYNNIVQLDQGIAKSLAKGGLNADVFALLRDGDILYVAGNFTNTSKSGTDDLANVAAYATSSNSWQALGAGLNGRTCDISFLTVNTTAGKSEKVIVFSGGFTQINEFANNRAVPAAGFAIWVPSQKNWLPNIPGPIPYISGYLSAAIDVPNSAPLFAGSIVSQSLSANGAVALSAPSGLALAGWPVKFSPTSTSAPTRKRALQGQNVTGVVAGSFYDRNNRNITILGGHFTARGSNGQDVHNLLFIDGGNSNKASGLDSGLNDDGVILDLAIKQDTLFAGGQISGTAGGANINGLILYDLAGSKYASTQPAPLSGPNVAVNVIAPQPEGSDVYVGGSFDSAGSLGCAALCVYSTSGNQWNPVASGIGGTVEDAIWSGNTKLVIVGNLTANSTTSTSVAVYDTKARTWSIPVGASNIPGPISAITAATEDATKWWVAGTNKNGSAFLFKFDGFTWQSAGDKLGPSSIIRGIQVFSLVKQHSANALVDKQNTLLLTGQLNLTPFGNVSAALFNGTDYIPFALSNSQNAPGSLSSVFSQRSNFFKTGGGRLALGFVVLIGLAISLALIFILVVIGIYAERWRRSREGYVVAPTQMYDKHSNMDRIPPEHLFGALGGTQPGKGPGGAPMI
ncbi:MAG: hypothetical protein M1814_005159 [Vezdaea aestivalis]|nr:MAG: hypothetical protein M1814_005159 [Vezdaea aestivalis]